MRLPAWQARSLLGIPLTSDRPTLSRRGIPNACPLALSPPSPQTNPNGGCRHSTLPENHLGLGSGLAGVSTFGAGRGSYNLVDKWRKQARRVGPKRASGALELTRNFRVMFQARRKSSPRRNTRTGLAGSQVANRVQETVVVPGPAAAGGRRVSTNPAAPTGPGRFPARPYFDDFRPTSPPPTKFFLASHPAPP